MKLFHLLILLVLLIFNIKSSAQDSALCASAPVVFCSGFEEGNKDIWNDYDSNPDSTNLLMPHPGPFNIPGNHVMRLRVPPGRGGADLVKVLPGTYDKLYARWYCMWVPGYNFSARNHGSGLYGGPRYLLGRSNIRPDGSDLFSMYIEPIEGRLNLYTYYRGMYMDCANPNGACWGDHFPCWLDEGERICLKEEHRETIMPPLLETGKWYCIEIMLDAGTAVQSDSEADGVANFWIDGVEYGPFRHLWFKTTPNLKLNILWLSLFHHEEHSVEGILLDNVVVSQERVGAANPTNIERNLQSDDSESFSINFNDNLKTLVLSFNRIQPDNYTVEIYNIYGQSVYSEVLNNYSGKYYKEINLNRNSKGVYYIIIKIGNTLIYKKMIVI